MNQGLHTWFTLPACKAHFIACRQTASIRRRRSGLTLLEVLLALTIFLFAMVAIGRLISFGSERARDIQGREAQLCESKLAEVVAGAMPVSAGGSQEGTFEEDENWHWKVECQDSGYPGLWKVKVTVNRKNADGRNSEAILTQMVLDPKQRGSTLDTDPTAAKDDSSAAGGSTSPSSGGSGSPTTGGGATGGTGSGSRPATTGGGGTTGPAAGTGKTTTGGSTPTTKTGTKGGS